MNPYVWSFILIGISIMMYVAGYEPQIFDIIGKYDGTNYETIETDISSAIFSWDSLLALGVGAAVGATIGGLNLLVIVPFALLSLMVKFFVFPTSFITDSALPVEFKLIVVVIFYVTTYLTMISFVRG